MIKIPFQIYMIGMFQSLDFITYNSKNDQLHNYSQQ